MKKYIKYIFYVIIILGIFLHIKTLMKETPVDISALNNWCGSFSDGNLRIVGAYIDNGKIIDDAGNWWNIDAEINPDSFLMLWIADNHTSDDITDDIIVKVWTEVF